MMCRECRTYSSLSLSNLGCPSFATTVTNNSLAAQAVAGPAAVDHMQRLDGIVRSLASQLKAKPDDIPARVAGATK